MEITFCLCNVIPWLCLERTYSFTCFHKTECNCSILCVIPEIAAFHSWKKLILYVVVAELLGGERGFTYIVYMIYTNTYYYAA